MSGSVETLDTLLRSTTYLMNLITRKFAAEQGLSVPRFWVLINVSKNPGLTMGELQNKMYLAPSSVSALVEHLVDNGLLRRDKDSTDRRIFRLFMTSAGKTILDKITAFRQERLEEALDSAGRQGDFVVLKETLERLETTLKKQLQDKE